MYLRKPDSPRRALLDALLVALPLDEAMDVHARQVDLVGVEIARLDYLLHLGDAHLARGGGVGVEVAACAWLGLGGGSGGS